MGDEVKSIPDGPQRKEVVRLASRLQDTARGLGLERGLRTTLALVYERWRHLQGDAPWSGESEDGPPLFPPSAFSMADHPDGDLLYALIDAALDDFDGEAGRDATVLAAVFEDLVSRLEFDVRGGGESSTPRSIAHLMSTVLDKPRSIIDPACGLGNALRACAARFDHAILTGIDIDADNVDIAGRRFEMISRSATLVRGDVFDVGIDHLHKYDGVVLQPPWGLLRRQGAELNWDSLGLQPGQLPKGATRTDLGWLEIARQFLTPTGRAAVLLPRLPGGGSHEGETDRLLRLGAIEAVIALPQNMIGSSSLAANLVILRGEAVADSSAGILFIDAGTLGLSRARGSVRELTDADVEMLAQCVRSARSALPLPVEPYVGSIVEVERVVPGRGLQPQLYLVEPPTMSEEIPDPPAHLISSLRIGGLKAFGAPIDVELAPLTLVYGANSAGKSSLIQSLLLLKQSIDVGGLVTQGSLANVGSFTGASHRHEGQTIQLGFAFGAPTWNLPSTATADPTLPREVVFAFGGGSGGRGELEATQVGIGSHRVTCTRASDRAYMAVSTRQMVDLIARLPTLEYLPASLSPRADNDGRRRPVGDQRTARLAETAYENAGLDTVYMTREGLLPTGDVQPERVLRASLSEVDHRVLSDGVRRVSAVLGGVGAETRTLLESITYLGPLRSAPQRFYDRAAAQGSPGDGRDVAVFLFDNSTVIGHVNDWLKRLEVSYTVDVVPVHATGASDVLGDIVAMPLMDLRSGVSVSPADVGFGISQVLPIVVELTARQESVICVEQPETHLHPRLQAHLGDLFIDAVDRAGRRNQLIIETHSEHLMLRVQRRIREGAISHDQVAVLYVDQDQDGNGFVRRLRLDEDGDFLDEWPSGFFDERLDELFGALG